MNNTRNLLYGLALSLLFIASYSSSSSAMNLTLALPGGQAIQVTAEDNTSVEQLKKKVFGVTEISPMNQILFKDDKKLDNARALSSYSIKDGDTLRVEYGVITVKARKGDSGILWIIIGFVVIIGAGVFFMRKKPSDDTSRQ